MVLRFGVYYGIVLDQRYTTRQIELIEIEALLEAILKNSISKSMWKIECVDSTGNNTILIYHSGYSNISNGKTIILSNASQYEQDYTTTNNGFIAPLANLVNTASVANKLAEDINIYLSPYVDGNTSYIDYHVGYFLNGSNN